MKNFLSIHDISIYQFHQIMDLSRQIKENPQRFYKRLERKVLAMIFQKPSLRTRVSFEVGILQMGGETIYLSPNDIQLGTRESAFDVVKNLERWTDGIIIRTFNHRTLTELAGECHVPIINALTDLLHPCQAISDFFTLKEKKGDLHRIKLAYIGDGNNVCHSLILASAKIGSHISVASPNGFEPNPDILKIAEEDGKDTDYSCYLTEDPFDAVKDADVIYTDRWASMGQARDSKKTEKIFIPFQVNRALMAKAKPDAIFMHCLPAERGMEVTDEVIDSNQSIVYDEAENSLHVQKAIMILLLEDKNG